MPPRVEIYPLLRLFASLAIMTIGATGMYAVNVSLKPILVEFDSSRAAASLPYAFTMVGFGLGGILMGRISDRVGVFWPVLFASFMLSAGFAAVSMVEPFGSSALSKCDDRPARKRGNICTVGGRHIALVHTATRHCGRYH